MRILKKWKSVSLVILSQYQWSVTSEKDNYINILLIR